MQHIPVCLNCESNEVQAPYTFRDGSGFCSGSCEDMANNVELPVSLEVLDIFSGIGYNTFTHHTGDANVSESSVC